MTDALTQLTLNFDLASKGGAVPEWVHLLPATKGAVDTRDARGPYVIEDAQAVIDASFADGEPFIDLNHSTDLAAPKGGASPAVGWIKKMEARSDGIWGFVEWNEAGQTAVSQRAYRSLSPVLLHHEGDKIIRSIPRASLVNTPNLRGLAALNAQDTGMNMSKIAKALGLGDDADEDAILAAIGKMSKTQAAAQSVSRIAVAVGLQKDAGEDAILTAIQSAQDGGDSAEIIKGLQSNLSDVTAELGAIKEARAKEAAIQFVDAAIREGHVGVKPQRDRFISMHQKDPEGTEALIGGMPKIAGETHTSAAPQSTIGAGEKSPNEIAAAAQAYVAEKAKAGVTVTIVEAVQAVQEGKE